MAIRQVIFGIIALWPLTAAAQSNDLADPYVTRALVTGQDERNRPLGFRLCFEDVLVKVSGDASILEDPDVPALAAQAQQDIASYSYRDRFEGKPKHDEQGTYDRPFFLTCRFDHEKIDAILDQLGRKPWIGSRPSLMLLLGVHGRRDAGVLSSDGAFDPDMRESLATAAQRYGLTVDLPDAAAIKADAVTPETALALPPDRLERMAHAAGAEQPLIGDLAWSDAAMGWVAHWRLPDGSGWQEWEIRGVNYDEAFRDAVRGAMSVLSGHGAPHQKP